MTTQATPAPDTLAYARRLLAGEQPPCNTNVGTRHEWLRAAQEAVDGDASDLEWMICADNAPPEPEPRWNDGGFGQHHLDSPSFGRSW